MPKLHKQLAKTITGLRLAKDKSSVAHIISLFKMLNDAKFIKNEYKPWLQMYLVEQFLRAAEQYKPVVAESPQPSPFSVEDTEELLEDSPASKLLRNDLQRLVDKLKTVVAKSSKNKLQITETQAADAIKGASANYVKEKGLAIIATRDPEFERVYLIINPFIQTMFQYLLEQRGEITAAINNEINALQQLMLALPTEFSPAAANAGAALINIFHRESQKQTTEQSLSVRALQECNEAAHLATRDRAGVSCMTFVNDVRDQLLVFYKPYDDKAFKGIANHTIQKSVVELDLIDYQFRNEPAKKTKAKLDFLRNFIRDPLTRRKEADPYWFFEKHSQRIHKELQWLTENIDPENQGEVFELLKCVIKFNGFLHKLKTQNRCVLQDYATCDAARWLSAAEIKELSETPAATRLPYLLNRLQSDIPQGTRRVLLELYESLGDVDKDEVTEVTEINILRSHFLALHNEVGKFTFFSGTLQIFNKMAKLIKSEVDFEAKKDSIGKLAADEVGRCNLSLFKKLYLIHEELGFNILSAELKQTLQKVTDTTEVQAADAQAQKELKTDQLREELVAFCMTMLQRPELAHNFSKAYYQGPIDQSSLSGSERYLEFASSTGNVSAAHDIHRTLDDKYLMHRASDVNDLIKVFHVLHTDQLQRHPNAKRSIFIAAIGKQDGRDLLEYPQGRHTFEVEGRLYYIISHDVAGQREYDFGLAGKAAKNDQSLRRFVVYNIQSKDNGPFIFDHQSRQKLSFIAKQRPIAIHCHKGVGRTGMLHLIIAGYQLIDELHALSNINVLQALSDPENDIYAQHAEQVQALFAPFNIDINAANAQQHCAHIAAKLIPFLGSLERFCHNAADLRAEDITNINNVFVTLLGEMRGLRYSIQEADQMLCAVKEVTMYFAEHYLHLSPKDYYKLDQAMLFGTAGSEFVLDVSQEIMKQFNQASRSEEGSSKAVVLKKLPAPQPKIIVQNLDEPKAPGDTGFNYPKKPTRRKHSGRSDTKATTSIPTGISDNTDGPTFFKKSTPIPPGEGKQKFKIHAAAKEAGGLFAVKSAVPAAKTTAGNATDTLKPELN